MTADTCGTRLVTGRGPSPDRFDPAGAAVCLLGAAVCLLGVVVIMYAPR